MAGALDGIEVLDLSRGIAGPMATMLLADHGARVTRIEAPGAAPPRELPGRRAWDRGKRSAVLDLRQARDRDAFLALAAHADVVVESFAPRVSERLGIDGATLCARNPRLIHCSITGYGRGNRHSDRPGWDALVAARTGLHWEQRGWPEGAIRHMARQPDAFPDLEIPYEAVQGPPRPGPVFPASFFPSLGACYAATTAISAALYARELTGRGQRVETSLLQGALACAAGAWQRAERIDAPMFDSWILSSRSPKGHFQASDGDWIHNWVPNPRFLLTASEGEKLDAGAHLRARDDPDRFGTGPEEVLVLAHYQPILAERVRRFPASEWVDAAARAGMTLQRVRAPEEALADPWMLADGCVAEVADPELGSLRHVGIAYQLDSSPGEIRGPAPRTGEHTAEVRAEAAAAAARPAKAPSRTPRALRAPLDGIRVLDLGLAIAGPFGTQLLSDLGADVIKINALHDTYWHSNHIAYMANRGKRSIALNLKHPRAMELLHELVATADVVQHNMRYAAAIKLGVDYESLRRRNPRLVYCHTRGHERGPREALPGNDQTGGCLAGVQFEDGGMAGGGKPLWSLTSLGDTGNGFLSAIAILQALRHRERTGEGQMCTTAIVNAQLLNCSNAVVGADGEALPRPRTDARQVGFSAGYRLYETADGWLCLVLAREEHWTRLCDALGRAELRGDPRFASAAERARHDEALQRLLEEAFAKRGAREWFARLDGAGVPCEVCDPGFAQGLHDDPELVARGWVASYPHPFVGRLDQAGLLFDLSDTPGRVQGPPLVVGQHSRELLRELGHSDAEVDAFVQEGFVGEWRPDAG